MIMEGTWFKIVISFFLCVQISANQRWPLSGSCHPCVCQLNRRDSVWVKFVDCSKQFLKTVPQNLPRDLHALDLSHNALNIEALGYLCTFNSMQFLSLAFNGLKIFKDNTFMNCYDLLHLNLTGNKFSQLERGCFDGIGNVREIYGLEVESIDNGIMNKLSKLKSLELIFNGATLVNSVFGGLHIQELKLIVIQAQTLPNNLFDFGVKTLNDLTIIGPKLTLISENLFRGLAVLRKIYLDLENLTTLPEGIFHNSGEFEVSSSKPRNLQEIWILNVASLPAEIFNALENLNKLVLRGIQSLPSVAIFDDLLNMEHLDIIACGINQIPMNWFRNLFSLKTLKLSQMGIRNLEKESLDGLINLQELDLSYNVLRVIKPESLQALVNSIRNLTLKGNLLKTIDNNLFQKMFNLIYLDISDNKLDFISEDAFIDSKRLIFLSVHDNKLSSLPEGVFDRLSNLQNVNLAINTLTTFPLALYKPGYLFTIDLSDNRISRFPNDIHEHFPFLEHLNLANNPLYCDCDYLQLKLLRPDINVIGTCVFRFKYALQNISDIAVDDCFEPTTSSFVSPTKTSVSDTTRLQEHSIDQMELNSTSATFNGSDEHYGVIIIRTNDRTEGYLATSFQSTPPVNYTSHTIAPSSSVYYTKKSMSITDTPSNATNANSSTHVPPIFQEEKDEEKFTDNLVFRVAVGMLAGTMFVCGFTALVLWRKRVKQRNRYEVTSGSTAV